MEIAYRWISRDLGKLELVFSIILISILLYTFVNKSLSLFSIAEKKLVEVTVINIQTALNLHSAIQSIQKNTDNVVAITEGMNPIHLLQSEPNNYNQYTGSKLDYVRANQASIKPMANYLGEMLDPDIEVLERGNWYFDHNGKYFIYLIKHKELFSKNAGEPEVLKYFVRLNYNDIDNNQTYEASKDILESASFVKIESNK